MDDPGRLLELLPDDRNPVSWVRGDEGLVGWGEVARWTGSGPDRFAEADAWWRNFVDSALVRDEIGAPGTGPVAFASFTFSDDSAGSVLVVPRVVVGRRGDLAWITEFSRGDGPSAVHSVDPVRPSGTLRYSDGLLPVARYRAAVADAVRRMRAGELDKAALAHDLIAVGEAPLDPRYLLGGLAERYPTCWSFAVEGLVGATPELLVRRTGDVVESRVLAGTSREVQSGSSAAARESTARVCSCRSFVDVMSRPATPWSAASVAHIVPASTRDSTTSPVRRTSSSGVAPTSPSTANDQHVG